MPGFYQQKKEAGFTIVEVIASIAVLSFGIVLVYAAFLTTVTLTDNVSSRFEAAYLAQEGLEIIKNMRDNNVIAMQGDPAITWSTGLLGNPCFTACQADYTMVNASQLLLYDSNTFLLMDNDGFYGYKNGHATIFQRKITVTPVLGNDDVLDVKVIVTWESHGKPSSYEAEEYLYNYQ